jgi:Protein of unknown function (DUF3106)
VTGAFKTGFRAAAGLVAIALSLPCLGQRHNRDQATPPKRESPRPQAWQERPSFGNSRQYPQSHPGPLYGSPAASTPGLWERLRARAPEQKGEVPHPPARNQPRPPGPPRETVQPQREVPRPPVQDQPHPQKPQSGFAPEPHREVAQPPARPQGQAAGFAPTQAHEVPRPPQAGNPHAGSPQPRAVPRPPQAEGAKHIGDWLRAHQALSPAEQQKALRNDPQFRSLPRQQQQRLENRLDQLNSLPAQQQQRILNRAEVWEHLTPDQKQQVRGVHSQMQQLSPQRREMMKTALGDLRAMPPEQREKVLQSPRFRSMFSDHERDILRDATKLPLAPAQPPAPPE